MITSFTPPDVPTRPAVSVHAEPRMCQWCGRHQAETYDLDGAWCCELHRDADHASQPRPLWRTVPAGPIHDGFGGCVWCAQPLGSPDCPHPMFGVTR